MSRYRDDIKPVIIDKLLDINNSLEGVGRELYYAKQTYINGDSPEVHINRALEILGIRSPSQVGLSDRVIRRK
jgi:hypothetical protein